MFMEKVQRVVNAMKVPTKGTPDWHQYKILVDLVKNPAKSLLGNITVDEAKKTLKDKFKFSDDEIKKLED